MFSSGGGCFGFYFNFFNYVEVFYFRIYFIRFLGNLRIFFVEIKIRILSYFLCGFLSFYIKLFIENILFGLVSGFV